MVDKDSDLHSMQNSCRVAEIEKYKSQENWLRGVYSISLEGISMPYQRVAGNTILNISPTYSLLFCVCWQPKKCNITRAVWAAHRADLTKSFGCTPTGKHFIFYFSICKARTSWWGMFSWPLSLAWLKTPWVHLHVLFKAQ